MHSQLETPAGFTLMASDTPPGTEQPYQRGNNFSVSLSGDDEAELRGYWDGLADGRPGDAAAGQAGVGRRLRDGRRPLRRALDGQHRPAAGLAPANVNGGWVGEGE